MSLRRSRTVRHLMRRYGIANIALPIRLAQLPLRSLARLALLPRSRDRTLIVFGAPLDRFADNAAYLFLHMSRERSDFRCVWITGSKKLLHKLRAAGYQAESRWSWRGLHACITAGTFAVTAYASDVNRWCSDGALVLNLWHGVPLKLIERDIGSGLLEFMYRARGHKSLVARAFADETRPPDILVSPSAFVSQRCLTTAFDVPLDQCLNVGYPRNDHLRRVGTAPPDSTLVVDDRVWQRIRNEDFVVGFFPTWRDDDSPFMTRSKLSLSILSEVVANMGGLLVYKPHINTIVSDAVPPTGAVTLDADDDLNAYLPLCSVLITDYSSVAFDFLLLDRPILYYVPDLEAYKRGRGLYFSPEEAMPGPLLSTPEQLYAAVAAIKMRNTLDPRVEQVRSKIWGPYDSNASSQIADHLQTWVGAT